MAARCPASNPAGLARLPRHRLVVMREGYLSVARDPRREVLGLLWEIALADMPALDRYEDVASGLYRKVQQSVLTVAGPRRALVYVGRSSGPGIPQPGYLEGVVSAAARLGFPAEHLNRLEALGPAGQSGRAHAPARHACAATRVTPTRGSPMEPQRAAFPPGWRWTP